MTILVTVEGLAVRLHKSVASVRSDATRNPSALPPRCRLPHTKRILWREQDIDQWLAGHVVGQTPPDIATLPPARRGRPTKSEQVSRRRETVSRGR